MTIFRHKVSLYEPFTSIVLIDSFWILNTYPDFSTFNNYLTQTKLCDEINRRQTITVLAVANDAMGGVQGSTDVIKRIMSNHVVLDYYDEPKLSKLSKKSSLLTTLFQSTGDAMYQQGFLNVTDMKNGEVMFGSAVKGSSLNAKLIKKIAAQPYNISVLQISAPIVADGIQNLNATAAAPPPKKSPSPPPSASPKKAPSPKNSKASPPPADTPADEPAADAPADAPSSPPSPVADAADAPAPSDAKKSSATSVTLGSAAAIVVVALSSWVAL
ncbi:Fasciclin-like arabinogalactan protein [Thalictrum thalictroides]|uniref:Fasciclin-like arabinogalactan protein n=1 Tax=Thalictrum thalictroides TaxID=46969 RepID=A0A7J6VHE5_THATH|nr:Fasciclin-like arabinogalactan protein [Thalictrum thalictroides]